MAKKSGGKGAKPNLKQGHLHSLPGDGGMGDKSLDWGKGQPSVNDAGRNSAEGMKDLGGRVA